MKNSELLNFYSGKKVLVTGHTGFKGSWLVKILKMAGAEVTGYSLEAPTNPNLFEIAKIDKGINSIFGDIRDYQKLSEIFDKMQPEIVFHLAAQPIVRVSYVEPRRTYETNVMGTVNICEAIRLHDSVKSFVNITTDKVYKNNEWYWGYRENEPLDGFDPYSNSKSCSELVTHSYINSFFGQNKMDANIGVSTARAGNVIGGGDFAQDRIIPDCVRAARNNQPLIVRNMNSIRPYQHVLEPLFAYLLIAAEQYYDHSKAGYYNVGPDECDCISTGELVKKFQLYFGNNFKYEFTDFDNSAPHEANLLKLDTSLLKTKLFWKPKWHIDDAVLKTVEWSKAWIQNDDSNVINLVMEQQIRTFFDE